MKLVLPASVSSKQDVGALILEVHEYERWFTHNAVKEKTHAKRGTPLPTLSPLTLELIKSWSGKKLLTTGMLDELVRELEKIRTTAPSATITLAAPVPHQLKEQLVAWCREHIASDVLVSFDFNSTILGGMVVRHKSHVFDWSFRRKILQERAKFPEVLRHV